MSSTSKRLFTLVAALMLVVTAVPAAPSAAVAAEWGEISGTVTDEATGLPIEGIRVCGIPWTPDALWGQTNAEGQYVIRFLESGTYIVNFACESAAVEQPGYLIEWWDDQKDSSSADLVTVVAGSRTTGIDAALTPAGSISGRVTDEGTGLGLADVFVTAQTCSSFCSGGWAHTDADGFYQVTNPMMAAGEYKVVFDAEPDYVREWWNNQSDFTSGYWVSVVNGTNTPNINAALTSTAPPPPSPPPECVYNPSVIRLAGIDRYATAVEISEFSFRDRFLADGVPVVFIATGEDFPDALAAGPAAALQKGPLLLVSRTSIPSVTAAELERLKPQEIVIVGGTGVVSTAVESMLDSVAPTVTRLAGVDRFATAAAVSATYYPPSDPLDITTVLVATGFDYPDALAGVALTGRLRGPVLLVRDDIPPATASELVRLDPDEIVVLGGSGVVSDAVVDLLSAYAPSVTRLAGSDRYATAAAISQAVRPSDDVVCGVGWVYVSTGEDFPDALAIGPKAGGQSPEDWMRGSILLVRKDSVPWQTQQELQRLNPAAIVIVGGTGVISSQVENQLSAGTATSVKAILQSYYDLAFQAADPPPVIVGPPEVRCDGEEPVGAGDVDACQGIPRTEPDFDLDSFGIVVYMLDPTRAAFEGGTDAPGSMSALMSLYELAPKGLSCRDLMSPDVEAFPFSGYSRPARSGFFWSLVYWSLEGEPDRMDADRDGIPCETLFNPEVVSDVLAGGPVS